MLLLSENNILSGKTLEILHRSRNQDKEISDDLYREYKALRYELLRVISESYGSVDGEKSIEVAQKILDRIIFIAFAEDRGLLPKSTLAKACVKDVLSQRSVWENFKLVFDAVNKGNESLRIFGYNGGLFDKDVEIEKLRLTDGICERLGCLGNYDYGSEVSVTILGHIFEQSISDLENLLKETQNGRKAEASKEHRSQRRQDGIVYTPDHIARFIVVETLGKHLQEIFAGIASRHAKKSVRKTMPGARFIHWRSKNAETKAWGEYRDAIKSLRIVDPACGSGVFLIIAFEYLRDELHRVNKKIAALEGREHIDSIIKPDSEILTNNLFGVDVNIQSVEIAKLSLWINTAQQQKTLDDLSRNIVIGDSLIEDADDAYQGKGFDWNAAFPEVFNKESGGFDIVLGNPPYVRQELISDRKPYLKEHYSVADGKADLYCYFYERGLKLLKPGGRLGFISSRTFIVNDLGKNLRRYLLGESCIETIVDFGTKQAFEGATTYTSIIVARRGKPQQGHNLHFWNVGGRLEGNFLAGWNENRSACPQESLSEEAWVVERGDLRSLLSKINTGKTKLKDLYGPPLYGIKTGCNEAFVVSEKKKQQLCLEDPKSLEFLKPTLTGSENKRWRAESTNLYMIYIPNRETNIDSYPAIRQHLANYREVLKKQKGCKDWYVIRGTQKTVRSHFDKPKICFSAMGRKPSFHMDLDNLYLLNSCYFIPSSDYHLVAYLNSRLVWFLCSKWCSRVRGEYMMFTAYKLADLPLPPWTEVEKKELADFSKKAHRKGKELWGLRNSLARRLPNLIGRDSNKKPTRKLQEWWLLDGFEAFYHEVKKARKKPLSIDEGNEWEDRIRQGRAAHDRISGEIASIEAEIDRIVYSLFELTPDEIRLLEENLK